MKKTLYRNNLSFVMVAISPLLLAACGGSSDSTPVSTPAPAPTTPPAPLPQKQEQTIAAFTVAAMTAGESSSVSTSASSGLPVTFSSDTPSTCTVTAEGVVTAVGYGTCTVAANQFGNDTYRQITVRSSALIIGAQTVSLALPQLIVGETIPVTFSATSQLPVTLTSKTLSTCTVQNGLVKVVATGPASCTIVASQDGVKDYYAAATPVSVTTAINAADSSVVENAQAEPTLPQANSLAAEGAAHEGLYLSSGGMAFIDKNDNFSYIDSLGTMFGSLVFTSSSWVFGASSVYYSNSPHVIQIATGSGTLTTVTPSNSRVTTPSDFKATTLSFTTNPSPLDLTYSYDNKFALDTQSLAGVWYANTTTARMQLTIDDKGGITGTLVSLKDNALPSRCLIKGGVMSSDSATKHNMFDFSLSGSTDKGTGTSCDLNSNYFLGHATVRFLTVTSNPANGLVQSLVALTRTTDNSLLPILLYKEAP